MENLRFDDLNLDERGYFQDWRALQRPVDAADDEADHTGYATCEMETLSDEATAAIQARRDYEARIAKRANLTDDEQEHLIDWYYQNDYNYIYKTGSEELDWTEVETLMNAYDNRLDFQIRQRRAEYNANRAKVLEEKVREALRKEFSDLSDAQFEVLYKNVPADRYAYETRTQRMRHLLAAIKDFNEAK